MIISFVGQKGGTGKSSLAIATAVELAKNNFNVRIIDLDLQQGTSYKWAKGREKSNKKPHVDAFQFATIKDVPPNGGYDATVIDAPARASLGTVEVAKISNIIIQPASASLADLEPAILLNYELTEKGVPKSKIFFAAYKVNSDAEYRSIKDYLEQGKFNLLGGYVKDRTSYREAMNEFKTITENRYLHPRRGADQMIQSIFDQIK